jgi:hypothetical protein
LYAASSPPLPSSPFSLPASPHPLALYGLFKRPQRPLFLNGLSVSLRFTTQIEVLGACCNHFCLVFREATYFSCLEGMILWHNVHRFLTLNNVYKFRDFHKSRYEHCDGYTIFVHSNFMQSVIATRRPCELPRRERLYR